MSLFINAVTALWTVGGAIVLATLAVTGPIMFWLEMWRRLERSDRADQSELNVIKLLHATEKVDQLKETL